MAVRLHHLYLTDLLVQSVVRTKLACVPIAVESAGYFRIAVTPAYHYIVLLKVPVGTTLMAQMITPIANVVCHVLSGIKAKKQRLEKFTQFGQGNFIKCLVFNSIRSVSKLFYQYVQTRQEHFSLRHDSHPSPRAYRRYRYIYQRYIARLQAALSNIFHALRTGLAGPLSINVSVILVLV